MEIPGNKQTRKKPERPLECSECKKRISIIYTEIVGDITTETSMCSDCPELQRRLKGVAYEPKAGEHEGATAGVACGNCGTTLESVKMGSALGCPACYEVFAETILSELRENKKLPHRLIITTKSVPIHIGRNPGEAEEMTPTIRLLALKDALNETLKREDFEQAAILRDQIQEITDSEKKNEPKKRRKSNK